MGLLIVDGFEHGSTGTGLAGPYGGLAGTTHSIVTSPVRTGTKALQVASAANGTAQWIGYTGLTARVLAGSFYFRFLALPSVSPLDIAILGFPGPAACAIRYNGSTDGKFSVFAGAGRTSFGPVVAAGQWYLIDWSLNTTTSTFDFRARVDGNAATEGIRAPTGQTPVDVTAIRMGTGGTDETFTAYYDDFIATYAASGSLTPAYPIGAHSVVGLEVAADGTHSAAASIFQTGPGSSSAPTINGTGTTTSIATAATPWTVTMPTGIVAGERLLCFYRAGATQAPTLPSGWSWVLQNDGQDASDDRLNIITKEAAGSDTLSLAFAAAVKGTAHVYRIGGHDPAIPPLVSNTVIGTGVGPNPTVVGGVQQASTAGGGTNTAISAAPGTQRLAQGFRSVATGLFPQVEIWLDASNGSPTYPLTVAIHNNATNLPGTTVLATGTITNPVELAWNKVTFASPASLVDGTDYWIVVGRQDGSFGSPYWTWGQAGSDIYANGVPARDNSGSWSALTTNTTWDFAFRMGRYGNHLFFAWSSLDGETQTVSAYPTGYSLGQLLANSGTGGNVDTNVRSAVAAKAATGVISDDPDQFQFSAVANSGGSSVSLMITGLEAATQLVTGATTVWTLLDDPLDVAFADYINQYGSGTTSYLETVFEDLPAGSDTVLEVMGYATDKNSITGASAAIARVVLSDGTSVSPDLRLTGDNPATTATVRKKILTPPSGGWDRTKVNGLKYRTGFGDGDPDVYFSSVLLEVAMLVAGGPVEATKTHTTDASLKGTLTDTHATDAVLTAPGGPTTVTKTHATDAVLQGTGLKLEYSFDGGADEANVSTADTHSGDSFNTVSLPGQGTSPAASHMKYDTAYAAGGTGAGARAQTTDVAGTFVAWSSAKVGSQTESYGRVYLKVPTIPANRQIMRFRDATVNLCVMRFNTVTDQFDVIDAGSTARVTSAKAGGFAPGEEVRVEVHVIHSATVGHIEMRLFYGANLHSETPSESVGDLTTNWNTGANPCQNFSVGLCTLAASGTNEQIAFDAIEYNTFEWPGPLAVAGPSTYTVTHATDALLVAQPTKSLTTDARIIAEVTKTHTTGALLVAQPTKTHATDALVVAQVTKTHLTDAIKAAITTVTVTHTTGALLAGTFTKTHLTDAIKAAIATVTATHTTDAKLLGTFTKTHVTDAVLAAITVATKTHTTDAKLLATLVATHTTDAVLVAQPTKTHVTDAIKVSQPVIAHTTGALLVAQPTKTHLTDAVAAGIATATKTHTTDAKLQGTLTLAHTTGAVLQATFAQTHTTGAVLLATVTRTHVTDALLQGAVTRTHLTDAIVQSTATKLHTTDALLFATVTKTQTADARLVGLVTKSTTTDALLVSQPSRTHATDAVIVSQAIKLLTTDALVRSTLVRTHTTDAFLLATVAASHTTDAFLKATVTRTHLTDANISSAGALTHGTDASLKGTLTQTHTTDALKVVPTTKTLTTGALLRAEVTKAHQTDALLVSQPTKVHTTDALVQGTFTKTVLTDALVASQGLQKAHATDALLRATVALTHATDAHRVGLVTKTHTTNALVVATPVKTHLTDAALVGAVLRTHTTDAIKATIVTSTLTQTATALLQATATRTHTTGALLVSQPERTHITGAILVGATLRTLNTDALVVAVLTRTHTTDAFRVLVGLRSITTDASVVGIGTPTVSHTTTALAMGTYVAAHTTSALLRLTATRTHTTDALLLATRTRTLLTDAFLLGTTGVTHTTTAVLRATSTRTHTTDARLQAPIPFGDLSRVTGLEGQHTVTTKQGQPTDVELQGQVTDTDFDGQETGVRKPGSSANRISKSTRGGG